MYHVETVTISTMGGKCAFAASAKLSYVDGDRSESSSQGTGVCAAIRKAASSPLYQMPSRSISEKQKIKVVETAPNSVLRWLIITGLSLTYAEISS